LFKPARREPRFLRCAAVVAGDIVLFALIVVLAPPALLVAVEALAGLVSRSAQRLLHVVFVAAAVAAITMQVLKRSAGLTSTATIVALAALAGIGMAILYRRVALTRSFLSILALAPVFFLGYFLLVSPVAQLTLARESDVPLLQLRAEAPVVMVVFDELPISSLVVENGETDRVRYPNFAELAADSTWFRNTSTVSYSPGRLRRSTRGRPARSLTQDRHVRTLARRRHSDHGITFRLGQPQRDPTAATLPDIALVPLFVSSQPARG
jgi:hypothetical protein